MVSPTPTDWQDADTPPGGVAPAPAAPFVVGLVVVDSFDTDSIDPLPGVMRSLADQTTPVDVIAIVARGDGAVARVAGLDADTYDVALSARGHELSAELVDAVSAALDHVIDPTDVPAGDAKSRWWWVLSDRATPQPDALQRMLDQATTRPDLGILGCKHRESGELPELTHVGFHTTVGGRYVPLVNDAEHDQGQYDYLSDIVAVPTIGMLCRSDVVTTTGGMTARYDSAGATVDLCVRAHGLGYGVALVPGAVCADQPRESMSRSDSVRLRITHASTWWLPMVFLSVLLGTAFRGIGKTILKNPAGGLRDVRATFGVLADVPGWIMARRRVAVAKRRDAIGEPVTDSSGSQLTFGETIRWHWDSLRYVTGTHTEEPVIRKPGHVRESGLLARVLFSVAALGAVLWSTITWWSALTDSGAPVSALGDGLGTASRLWDTARAAWLTTSFGAAGPPDPVHGVWAVLVAVFDGHTSWVATAVMVSAMPLAAVTMWFATSVVTTSWPIRLWAALTWAGVGCLHSVLGRYQIATALAIVVLPSAVSSLLRIYTARTDRTLMGTVCRSGLLTALVSLLNVPLGGLLWAATAVGAAVTKGAWLPRVWHIVLSGVVVLPYAAWAVATGAWRAVLAESGVPVAVDAAPAWQWLGGVAVSAAPEPALAASWLSGLSWWQLIPGAVALTLPVIAVLATLDLAQTATGRGAAVERRRRLAIASWGLAAAAMVTAAATAPVTVASVGSTLVPRAVEPFVALIAVGLVFAAGAGLHQRVTARAAATKGHNTTRWAVLTVLGVTAVAGTLLTPFVAYTGHGSMPAVNRGQLPLMAEQAAAAPDQGRTVIVSPSDSRLYVYVRDHDGATLPATAMSSAARSVPSGGEQRLAETVSALVQGSPDAVADLRSLGVAYVAVPERGAVGDDTELAEDSPVKQLQQTLNGLPGLEQAGATDDMRAWRVADPTNAATHSSLAWVAALSDGGTETGRVVLGTAPDGVIDQDIPAGENTRRVVLAQNASSLWHATLNGQPLQPVTVDGWAQGFELGSEGGHLHVQAHSVAATATWWGQCLIGLLAVVGLLPTWRRRAPVRTAAQDTNTSAAPELNQVGKRPDRKETV